MKILGHTATDPAKSGGYLVELTHAEICRLAGLGDHMRERPVGIGESFNLAQSIDTLRTLRVNGSILSDLAERLRSLAADLERKPADLPDEVKPIDFPPATRKPGGGK